MTQDTPTTPAPGRKTSSVSRRPSRRMGAMFVLCCLGGLAVWGVRHFQYASVHVSTDDAFVESHVVTLSPRVAGHVREVLVTDNQQVHRGQDLIRIDDRDCAAALDAALAAEEAARAGVTEAEAQAAAAGSELDHARADLLSEQASLAQVRTDVGQSRAEHQRETSDLQRMRNMAATGAVSRQDLDHAVAAADIARARLGSSRQEIGIQSAKVDQARAAIKVAEDSLRQARAGIAVRRADLQQASSAVDRARLNVSYTTITAPCDGRVTKKAVEAGAYVQVGQSLLAVVGREVWVVANFKETQIADMRPGQPVDITVDAYPDAHFSGHVDSLQQGTGSRFSLLPPENSSGNFIKVVQRVPVKIVFDDAGQVAAHLLAPGMSVIPEVDLTTDGSARVASAE